MSAENKSDCKETKDEKCTLNRKLYSTTIRLSVSLSEPDEESCSVFDYISLIAKEKRNRKREKEKNAVNGSIAEFEENDDDVKRIAQQFEEKYGGGNTTKKKKKKKAPTFYNYTELATGYDESDSFIDNSEAFDEALPDEMETFHGGYYVNCGQLEFKKVELGDDNSDLDDIRVGKKKNCFLKSDDSDSDDGSVKSDIDKSESFDDETENAHKKLPEEPNHKAIENIKIVNEAFKATGDKLKMDKFKENVPNNVPTVNGEVVKKRKKYKKRHMIDDDPIDGLSKPKKKAITVKTLLEEKRVVFENGETYVVSVVGKPGTDARNSINDVIESVVNAGKNHLEDSRDSTCSSSDTKSIDSRTSFDTEKDSHHDEMEVIESLNTGSGFPNIPKEQIKLPDNLPSDVLELITQIKNSAQSSDLGVRTFFNPYINSKLLCLETKVRPLMSTVRHALYAHLASFLPCSKDTLMKRAKKLLIEEEEEQMKEPFTKLKASIDKMMPTLMNNYAIACLHAEEKAAESAKSGELDDKKSSSIRSPHKKFIWTEETRSCVRELVACRMKCFHMLKPRKESPDDYVKKFLENKVKPLWPQGWMETSILWKESHTSNNTSSKPKRVSLTSQNGATTTATTITTTTSMKKSHSTVPSSNNCNMAATTTTTYAAADLNNFLSNSLTLQSLAMQYAHTDRGYPIPSTTSLPYRPDLTIFSASNASMPYSMDFLSRLAMANNQFLPTYKKSTSPPKKQSPSPGHSSQRSTTPSFADVKKAEKKSEAMKLKQDAKRMDSTLNEMMKMDMLMNAASSKNKKEHHMLNHISQYNKHYSHKTEKRKSVGHERKETVADKTPVNTHRNVNSAPPSTKVSPCEVLDLSPNKNIKSEKPETVHHVDHHKNDSASISPATSVTAKDHNYWANSMKKDDEKEDKHDKSPTLSLIQRSINTTETTITPLHAAVTSKPTHISRKHRILQESAKSQAQEVIKSSTDNVKSSSYESLKSIMAQPLVNYKETTYVNESQIHMNSCSREEELASIKEEKKLPIIEEKHMIEETTTATDILSKIINDTLRDNSTPLLPQLTNPLFEDRIKQEVKVEEVEVQLNDFIEKSHPPSRESQTPLLDKSSPCSVNSERKTPSSDRAEIEAAEVIKDLLVLNQIGGHNPRRIDYQDSRYIDNRHLNSDLNYSNGSMLSQSSPHNSSSKTTSIPRMSLTGFQDEFLQHIFKMDRDSNSSYNRSSIMQHDCFSSDFSSMESNKSSFNRVSASSSNKPGNMGLNYHHNTVIMPPSSLKWHIPESKS